MTAHNIKVTEWKKITSAIQLILKFGKHFSEFVRINSMTRGQVISNKYLPEEHRLAESLEDMEGPPTEGICTIIFKCTLL